MTVSHLGTVAHADMGAAERRASWQERGAPKLGVGQPLELAVKRQLNEHLYLISFANEEHVVESAMQLRVGGIVHAQVVAIGDKLELRYVDAAAPPASSVSSSDVSSGGGRSSNPLAKLQLSAAIDLTSEEYQAIDAAMADVPAPETMAVGGLYLHKAGYDVDARSLEAIYNAQAWDRMSPAVAHAAEVLPLLKKVLTGDDEAGADLAAVLQEAVSTESTSAASAEMSSGLPVNPVGDERDLSRYAKRLLNLQDDSSLSHRFGTLPILVAGELVELDLVYFRERDPERLHDGLRRLVMTFSTETLGKVEIRAQALDSRLAVSISAQSQHSVEVLAGHADDVKDLVARFGWNVESVAYQARALDRRAAAHIVDHVLQADTIDKLV